MTTLPQLETLSIGWPITRSGVSFFPVYLPDNPLPAIATGADSGLVVEELDDPDVQTLRVRNPVDRPVLVVEGEHLIGGDQNRSLNASVLVPSLGDLEIPVSCLEQGRWGRRGRQAWTRDDAFTPNRVRARKDAGVAYSQLREGSRRGDQGEVWRSVNVALHAAALDSDTDAAAALREAPRRRGRSTFEAMEQLAARGPLPGQCGIVVVHGARVMAMDLFGAPHLLAAHWAALVRSHLLEPPVAKGSPSATRVLDAVRRFAAAKAEETPGVGLGVERRIRNGRLSGHALRLNGSLVHAAFFASEPRGSKGRGGGGPDGESPDGDSPEGEEFESGASPERTPEPGTDWRPVRSPDLDTRAQGLMAGIAVGNLLGLPMEGWSRRRITSELPEGVRDITARRGYPDDDDLAQAIVLAEAAAAGSLDPDDLGRRFWEWAETNGQGMGGLTRDVLRRYGGAAPRRLARNRRTGAAREPAGMPILKASRTAWAGSRAGNGAAMRCAPIAVRWRDDPAALVRNSIVSAAPTHWDRRCGWSCALLNLAAAAALRGASMSGDELLAAALDGVRAALPEIGAWGYRDRVPQSVAAAVRLASEMDIDDLTLDGDDMGYTLLALQVGLIVHWRAPSFEEGLRRVIMAGGDTDTNGAVAGAQLGARFGVESIPERWRQRTAALRAERAPMESYADRLLARG